MKKFSKKILISVIAMLVLFATAFAALSFTMADEENSATRTSVYAATGPQTIIDYIIENSKVSASSTATDADPVYHILELGSSDTPSDLMDLVDSTNFRELVINGNKSKDYPNTMDATAQIEYIYYNATEGNYKKFTKSGGTVTSAAATNDEIVKAIQKADLCYVSNDPNEIFANGNDISEDIKIALSSYATGLKKPLIIDSHNKTQEVINLTSKKMKEIATYDFAPYGGTYSTYMWDNTKPVGQFMNLTNLSDLYIPIDGDVQKSKWIEVPATGTSEYVAKVLTINAGSDNTLTNLFKDGFASAPDYTGKTDINSQTVPDAYTLPTSSGVYQHGYMGRALRPTAFIFETLNISTNLADLADPTKVDLSEYDFIIIEKDTAEINFLSYMDSYNKLMSAMYGLTHILYDKSMVMNTTGNALVECTAANFKYVYDKVATPTDKARFDFIMVGTRTKMANYAASISPEGVKDIADVINAGAFRNIRGNGGDDASNVYTALEIEPCYPINTELAELFSVQQNGSDKAVQKMPDTLSTFRGTTLNFDESSYRDNVASDRWGAPGFYYLRTNGVLDASSDEISYDNNKSVTQMLEDKDYSSFQSSNSKNIVDYYNWTLTKAKVAHALGVENDEVRVVHMSSTEFAASKDTLLDNYDMIFIGGDTSSVTPSKYLKSKNDFYKMYRHNGEIYNYPSDFIGGKDGTVGVLTGNDITDDKLKELKEYVSKGMPVVFDTDVTSSFNSGIDIDPNSNMYDFLSYASGSSFAGNTIWDFDDNYTIKLANVNNKYGKTYSGYVTVFAQDKTSGYSEDEKSLVMGVRSNTRTDSSVSIDDYLSANLEDGVKCETQLSDLITKHQRPRLAVTLSPKRFIEGDSNTWITSSKTKGTNLVWNYKVNGGTDGTVELYIDDDSNNRFTAEEKRGTGSNGTLSLHLGADYYGPVYWKIISTDSNGLSASTTGICKIKRREDQEKMVVDILQINPPMPVSDNNKCTLIFCTECQQTRGYLYGNRASTVGKYSKDSTSGLSSGFKDMTYIYSDTTSTDPGMNTFDQVKAKINADPLNKFDYSAVTIPDTLQSSINNYLAFKYMNNEGTGYNDYTNNLGIHEHKFGIVKYYENLKLLSVDGTEINTGLDDWTTNWFDELQYDYDVNLTTMTTRQYEAIVGLVNNIYNGQSDNDAEKISGEFKSRESEYKLYYDCMRSLINGTFTNDKTITSAEKNKFVKFMTTANNATDSPGLGLTQDDLDAFASASSKLDAYLSATPANTWSDKTREEYGAKEIANLTDSSIPRDERQYYDVYSLVNARSQAGSFYDGYDPLYQVWRNAKMYEIYFKNQYVKYSLLASVNLDKDDYKTSSYKDTISLDKTFNCIVFGASEDFNGDDLKTDASCYAVLDYIEDEGNLILFHDTLTAMKSNGSGGTERMTRLLSDAFGQNARHLQYTNTDNKAVENILSVSVAGKTKKVSFKPSHGKAELKVTGGSTTVKDQKMYLVGHYMNNKPDQTSDELSLPGDLTSATINFYFSGSQGTLMKTEMVDVQTGSRDAHNINLKMNLMIVNNGNWTDSIYNWGGNNFSEFTGFDVYLNGNIYDCGNLTGNTVVIPNGTVSGFTFNDPVFTNYSGTDDQHDQELVVTYVDSSNNPVGGANVTVKNQTTGDVQTVTTNANGEATFTYSNFSSAVTNGTGVETKPGYKNSEYFISPNLSGQKANINTLTSRCAYYKQDGTANLVWPTKYTFFDYHSEDAEYNLHGDHDMRTMIHMKGKGNTDATSQTNKGIVTMYPFTIGNKMKVSNTTSQSYALDIEDPNITVYYTLEGGTPGTLSSMYAADPHNGQENYFIYQYGSITYTGAGHSAITGYGRDNNDERRLFINIIVNAARKSTMGPDLRLYDYGSTEDNLKNEVIRVVNDSDADYAITISDYTDDVWFDYLATMATNTKFDWVQIFFDVDRDNSDIEILSAGDVLIFEGDDDPTNGQVHEDIPNNIGDGLLKEVKTGIPHLAKDTSNVPNLVLKESYFNSDNKAYIIVRVRDSKGNEDFKRLRIEFKPDLIDLN